MVIRMDLWMLGKKVAYDLDLKTDFLRPGGRQSKGTQSRSPDVKTGKNILLLPNKVGQWQPTLVGLQSIHWEGSLKPEVKVNIFCLVDDMKSLQVSEQRNGSMRGILWDHLPFNIMRNWKVLKKNFHS